MTDSPVPAEGTVQVASEQSPRESSEKKHRFQNRVKLMLHATRWLSVNMQKNGSTLPRTAKEERKLNGPSFLGGIHRLQARLSLQTRVRRARTQAARMSKRNISTPHVINESAFGESEAPLDQIIVDFAAESAFQGLSKSARKNMLRESPVPLHADLRPKKLTRLSKNI